MLKSSANPIRKVARPMFKAVVRHPGVAVTVLVCVSVLSIFVSDN